MNKKDFQDHRARLYEERTRVSESAQKEYAYANESAFDNFERVGNNVKTTCEHCGGSTRIGKYAALAVYLYKHFDGILSWIGGNHSQREDVRGRLTDAANYADLMDGMIVDDRKKRSPTQKGEEK